MLVERVEGFASEKEWRRAYAEINQFEKQLADHGIVLVKYWMHLSKQEQLRRFHEREQRKHGEQRKRGEQCEHGEQCERG